jgi:hypothetical protein
MSQVRIDESPSIYPALKHVVVTIEFDDHFNLLKTVSISYEHLAAGVARFSIFGKIQAGFVPKINLPLDGFAATLASDVKHI